MGPQRDSARCLKSLFKKSIPSSALAIARDCAGLPAPVAATYLRLRAARWLRLRSDRRKLRRQPRSLLFVCHGNVMRSPVAAELFRMRMGVASPLFAVDSAGTWTKNGRPADPRAFSAAAGFGFTLDRHRSQLLTALMVERAELICVMDYRNEAEVVARFPRAARKTILLGGIGRRFGQSPSIEDPYTQDPDRVSLIYAHVSSSIDALVARLRPRE